MGKRSKDKTATATVHMSVALSIRELSEQEQSFTTSTRVSFTGEKAMLSEFSCATRRTESCFIADSLSNDYVFSHETHIKTANYSPEM